MASNKVRKETAYVAAAATVVSLWGGYVQGGGRGLDRVRDSGLPDSLNWTGFRGQMLWDWFELLLLPAALTITMALTSVRFRPSHVRWLRRHQTPVMAALAAGWVVTVIGGYALRWTWTGYQGNTLWDRLRLLLLPLVFPTILLPALLTWISGDAAGRQPGQGGRRGPAGHGRGQDMTD